MMSNAQNIELCGWETYQCSTCPYCEDDQCKFKEEIIEFLKWTYGLIKQRCRNNPIEWGTVYRYYYGKKEVHEWAMDYLPYEKRNKFWELWRDGGKEAFKKLGFGVFRDRMDNWILFWEIKFKDLLLDILQIEDPYKKYSERGK